MIRGPRGFSFHLPRLFSAKNENLLLLTHAARVWLEQDTENDASYYSALVGFIKHLVLNCNVCIRGGVVQTSQFTTSFLLPFDHLFRTDSELIQLL